MERHIVAGGGLAGLTAANALADRGHKVIVFEQSETLGGRAATITDRAYRLNFGPHALYLGSCASRAFREWSIPIQGRIPLLKGNAWLVRGEEKFPLITGLGPLLATRMFSLREKIEAARLLKAMTSPAAALNGSAGAWLDAHTRSPRVRDFGAAIIRVSTYSADLAHLEAGAMLSQVRAAFASGVMYLDHGWQTLVDALAQRARSHAVEIRCGEGLGSLTGLNACGVVLAMPPANVERVSGVRLPELRPVRAACLDLGLRRLPAGAACFGLGVDRPLYLSVHSNSAELAPAGAALVHVAKYLTADPSDAAGDRAELESFADLLMPGWRAEAELVRYLPSMTVAHAIPAPGGRPDVDVLGMDGVAVAGDWVGPEGMLADAAVASGLRAADAIQRRKSLAA